MFKLLFEFLFTLAVSVCLVINIISGSWLLVVLDAACLIVSIINLIIEFKPRGKDTNDSSDY